MYSEITREIRVTVRPFFLEDQSSPDEMHFVWAYHVRIENQGPQTVQLRNRYWRITDSMGRIQEVRGAGVVGEQPVLRPGEAFEYTSGTPLTTPSGIMVGTYQMESESGERFDVNIPAFSLDSPHQAIRLN
jgi:ApaG protein